ncbi:hypothetical protein N7478_011013 [Penicillium angulare]|uniref:uncharacterized protein n=1 Tax=Penicillium angulare TaxID=116970 RepID=UPI00254194D3|nr:uncharacterized protein N7478_011013 [Penicillium angulare]KAJ5263408.1 hypothetical protein N7478_011013 [Penicillium angulare]
MALRTLPLEIYARTIFHVSSIRALSAVSQTSRAMHSLCDMKNRERFHRICIDEARIEKTFNLLMEILKQRSLGKYVRKIEHRYRRPYQVPAYTEAKEQRSLSAEEMDLLRSAVQKAGFSGTQESAVINMLMQKDTSGRDGELGDVGNRIRLSRIYPSVIMGTFITQALTAMLISVSPNLEALTMTQPFESYDSFNYEPEKNPRESFTDFPIDRILRRANTDPTSVPYLQNLRKVYIIVDEVIMGGDDRSYVGLEFFDCIKLIDNLPSIESIGTDALIEDENDVATLLPTSSNISRVYLNHCALNTPYLAYIIQSCKVLKEFQYTIGGRDVLDGHFCPLNPKTFIKAISPHKDTLEVLDIDAEANIHDLSYYYDDDFARADKRFDEVLDPYLAEDDGILLQQEQFVQSFLGNSGCLKDFHALKRVSLGVGFLLYFARGVGGSYETRDPATFKLVECLPEGLEYLCIRGYKKGRIEKWDEQIDSLMTFWQSGKSNIKEITGVEEEILNAKDLDDIDNQEHLVWVLQEDTHVL